jgi:hypothetical protein
MVKEAGKSGVMFKADEVPQEVNKAHVRFVLAYRHGIIVDRMMDGSVHAWHHKSDDVSGRVTQKAADVVCSCIERRAALA